MAKITVKEIVTKFLDDNGFDGLYSEYCGCKKDDLGPCGLDEEFANCIAGHIIECDPETCPADSDCEWHIGPRKDTTNGR